MSFKIGFTAQTEPPKMPTSSIPRSATTVPKKSLVEVFFPDRNLTCSYYNDTFDLAKGDLEYGDAFEFDYISIVSMPLLFRYGVDGKNQRLCYN
jgi:hypothetical protein